jgi:hypothetical protein
VSSELKFNFLEVKVELQEKENKKIKEAAHYEISHVIAKGNFKETHT